MVVFPDRDTSFLMATAHFLMKIVHVFENDIAGFFPTNHVDRGNNG